MIRPWHKEDRAFVANSWLRSFSYSHWAGFLDTEAYWREYTPLVDRLLDTPGVRVDVFCNPEDQDQIMAWVCWEPAPDHGPPILHYLFVKAAFRDSKAMKPQLGVKLLEHAGMAHGKRFNFTFRTQQWDRYRQTHRLNAHFSPEIVRSRRKYEEERAHRQRGAA